MAAFSPSDAERMGSIQPLFFWQATGVEPRLS